MQSSVKIGKNICRNGRLLVQQALRAKAVEQKKLEPTQIASELNVSSTLGKLTGQTNTRRKNICSSYYTQLISQFVEGSLNSTDMIKKLMKGKGCGDHSKESKHDRLSKKQDAAQLITEDMQM